MTMRATAPAEIWLTAQLTGVMAAVPLTGRRVWKGAAPPEAAFPYATFTRIASDDGGPIGGETEWQSLVYQVLVIDRGADESTIEPIGEAVDDALLTGDASAEQDGYTIETRRIREITVDPVRDDGDEVVWVGGEYECWVQKAA